MPRLVSEISSVSNKKLSNMATFLILTILIIFLFNLIGRKRRFFGAYQIRTVLVHMSQFAAKFANIIRAMNCHVICVILANVANGLVFHNKPETAKKAF